MMPLDVMRLGISSDGNRFVRSLEPVRDPFGCDEARYV